MTFVPQVGQYLLTLPQQLEPFTLQDNPALIVALKYGKLPHTSQQGQLSNMMTLDKMADMVKITFSNAFCLNIFFIFIEISLKVVPKSSIVESQYWFR